MTINLTLPYPPSANNLFPTGKNNQRYISAQYAAWITAAGWELKQQRPGSIKGKVRVVYQFGRSDKKRRDLDNLAKATSDLLVKHGIIEDDSMIQEMTLKWLDGVPKVALVTVEAWHG